MASGYTANYGLCQWEPTDKFLREEFNQDNEKIDDTLFTLDQRTLGAEDTRYHVYQLLLRDYYEGKYTGFKQGLIFDGFQNQSGISQKTEGVLWSAGQIKLDSGQGNYSTNKVDGTVCSAGVGGQVMEQSWTPTGRGALNSITVYVNSVDSYGTPYSGTGKLEVLQGSEVLDSDQRSVTQNFGDTVFNLSVSLKAGTKYTLRYTAVKISSSNGEGRHDMKTDGNGKFAYTVSCTPQPYTDGELVTSTQNLGRTWTKTLAWVRYSGAAPILFLGQGEDWTAMETGTSKSVQNAQGKSCREMPYVLDQTGGPSTAVKMDLSGSCTVYDYGVMAL
ncbi:hypothetical protein AAAT94_00900 [Intestinimonas aquisgranensis]|nr:hypothetical protein [Intestinimonas aquisgranensis]